MSALAYSPSLEQLPIPMPYPEPAVNRFPESQPAPPGPTERDSSLSQRLGSQISTDFITALGDTYHLEYRTKGAEAAVLMKTSETSYDSKIAIFAPVYSTETGLAAADFTAINALEATYVFEDRSKVAEFIRRNRLGGLLLQAGKPLDEAFGKATIKILRLIVDDEGAETLFCLAMVSGELDHAHLALQSFDREWWLARCGLKAGLLNFDFELV